MPITHLLYLHGFRSSPQSNKARWLAEHMQKHRPEVHWRCPSLAASPAEAMDLVMKEIRSWPRESMAVIGSSLGGFYATWIAHQCACPSVLLNPAVDPARDLARYIGEHTAWHDPKERIFFRAEYILELQALDMRRLPAAAPELAIIAKGDELLDWREMAERYAHAQRILIEGSDHALSDFPLHLPAIMDFLAL
jgi:predicted esterase YcpF (UPF0227 family)